MEGCGENHFGGCARAAEPPGEGSRMKSESFSESLISIGISTTSLLSTSPFLLSFFPVVLCLRLHRSGLQLLVLPDLRPARSREKPGVCHLCLHVFQLLFISRGCQEMNVSLSSCLGLVLAFIELPRLAVGNLKGSYHSCRDSACAARIDAHL